jgi:hypothetical protein
VARVAGVEAWQLVPNVECDRLPGQAFAESAVTYYARGKPVKRRLQGLRPRSYGVPSGCPSLVSSFDAASMRFWRSVS